MMFKKIAAAAALTLLASSSFAAAPTAFYGGVDVGSTKIDGLGDREVSFGGFLGYGFNQNFAVEVGYRQLGKWDKVFGSGADVTAKQTHVSLVGSLPLTPQFDLFGRLGYNNVKAEASFGGATYGEDTNGALYGIGLGYSFAPNIVGRVEVQKPSSDSTNVGVSVAWKF
jgi:hypothetical protein